MLATLHIENLAVVKSLDLDFTHGFNILTGETGSGKSVIIDAIGMLLGNTFRRDMIRAGENEAMVSGYFTDIGEHNKSLLRDIGIEVGDENDLFVQRNLSASGKAVSRIGGRVVPALMQKEAVGLLTDIHGQQDNHKLLDEKNHLSILDSYAESDELLEKYAGCYARYCDVKKRLADAKALEKDKEQRLEYLKFRVDELEKAYLKSGEDKELETRLTLLRSAEKTTKQVNIISRALYKNTKGPSAYDLVELAIKSAEQLAEIIPDAEELVKKLDMVTASVKEVNDAVLMLADGLGNDPASELDRVQSRLFTLNRLQKKYGRDIDGLIELLSSSREEMELLDSSELTVKELNNECGKVLASLNEIASELSQKRKSAAQTLEKSVVERLKCLNMKSARFVVEFTPTEPAAFGTEKVRFLLSANSGEPPKPLVKTASGGELARIMLGIKSVLAEKEFTETLIYDEIDTGISGKTAQTLGLVLKQTSQNAQVICITHSAQIAAAADTHFCVSKEKCDDRVETRVQMLDNESRVTELARIMGGNEITHELLESAKQLMTEIDSASLI